MSKSLCLNPSSPSPQPQTSLLSGRSRGSTAVQPNRPGRPADNRSAERSNDRSKVPSAALNGSASAPVQPPAPHLIATGAPSSTAMQIGRPLCQGVAAVAAWGATAGVLTVLQHAALIPAMAVLATLVVAAVAVSPVLAFLFASQGAALWHQWRQNRLLRELANPATSDERINVIVQGNPELLQTRARSLTARFPPQRMPATMSEHMLRQPEVLSAILQGTAARGTVTLSPDVLRDVSGVVFNALLMHDPAYFWMHAVDLVKDDRLTAQTLDSLISPNSRSPRLSDVLVAAIDQNLVTNLSEKAMAVLICGLQAAQERQKQDLISALSRLKLLQTCRLDDNTYRSLALHSIILQTRSADVAPDHSPHYTLEREQFDMIDARLKAIAATLPPDELVAWLDAIRACVCNKKSVAETPLGLFHVVQQAGIRHIEFGAQHFIQSMWIEHVSPELLAAAVRAYRRLSCQDLAAELTERNLRYIPASIMDLVVARLVGGSNSSVALWGWALQSPDLSRDNADILLGIPARIANEHNEEDYVNINHPQLSQSLRFAWLKTSASLRENVSYTRVMHEDLGDFSDMALGEILIRDDDATISIDEERCFNALVMRRNLLSSRPELLLDARLDPGIRDQFLLASPDWDVIAASIETGDVPPPVTAALFFKARAKSEELAVRILSCAEPDLCAAVLKERGVLEALFLLGVHADMLRVIVAQHTPRFALLQLANQAFLQCERTREHGKLITKFYTPELTQEQEAAIRVSVKVHGAQVFGAVAQAADLGADTGNARQKLLRSAGHVLLNWSKRTGDFLRFCDVGSERSANAETRKQFTDWANTLRSKAERAAMQAAQSAAAAASSATQATAVTAGLQNYPAPQ